MEVDLTDTVIRLCLPVPDPRQTGQACAEVLADGLIRELYRMKRDLNSGI